MKAGDSIFVYGTLREGEASSLSEARRFIGMATHQGQSRINGDIYDLGWYPGCKLPAEDEEFNPDKPCVVGDVFSIDVPALPLLLDSYEGYPHLYDRRQVLNEEGHRVWVYTYNGEFEKERHIASGDWKRS